MRVFLKCSLGTERVCYSEALEITGKNFNVYEGILISECNFKDFLNLLLYSRSAERIGFLIGELKTKEQFKDYFKENLKNKSNLSLKFGYDELTNKILNFFKESKFCFKVEICDCFKKELKNYEREKFRKEISKLMIKEGFSQNLKKPNFYFFVFKINKNIFLGLDFGEVYKRNYAVFNTPCSLRPNIAYSILRYSGFTRNFNGTLIDITSKSSFLIEAYLYYKNSKNETKNKINESIYNFFINLLKENSFISDDNNQKDKKNNNKINLVAYSKHKPNLSVLRKNSIIANAEISFLENDEKLKHMFLNNEKKIVILQINNNREFFELKEVLNELKNSVLVIVSNKEISIKKHFFTFKEFENFI
ncbi:MAG: hypothetical protein QXU20_04980, partial [Candidatus Woesearchaeota archaeon]